MGNHSKYGAEADAGHADDAAAGAAHVCGQGCDGCENVDWGSCGNACCKLTATVDFAPPFTIASIMDTLNTSLTAGGIDGNFAAQPLAEGVSGFADLRPFNKSVAFIGQFHHMTSGPKHYTDTIDITIAPRSESSVTVKLFSLSLIGGAFGDAGQNYKNLLMVLLGANLIDQPLVHIDESCGGDN